MNTRPASGKSPIGSLAAKLRAAAENQNDDLDDTLVEFSDTLDAWVQEHLLHRLGRRADVEGAADTVFRAWHTLPVQMREAIAKAAEEEGCTEQLQAIVGNLTETNE